MNPNGGSAEHMRAIGARTRFQKGVLVANPRNTKPAPAKEESFHEIIERTLTPKLREQLVKRLVDIGLNDRSGRTSLAAIQELIDRLEGKPRQSVETTHSENDPLLNILDMVINEYKAEITEGEVVRVLPAHDEPKQPGGDRPGPETEIREGNLQEPGDSAS